MTNQEMVSAITTAIQEDSVLLLLIRTIFLQTLNTQPTEDLKAMMDALGLPYE